MKAKHILPFLILLLISCKKDAGETKTNSSTPANESPVVANPSEAGNPGNETTVTTDNKKLPDFYRQNEKKPQQFAINTSKDTTITCIEKTRIRISAGSFVNSKTNKPITGKVLISVTEYYKVSDILLARLSTTSNGNLLETGGMINITAMSGNERCELEKGKTIAIEFPRKEEKPGMQLFTGKWANNTVDWVLQKNTTDLNQVFNKVDQMPEFPGGMQKFYQYISRSIYNDDEVTTRIIAAFTIDKEGNVINPRIIRGSNNFMNIQIINALKKSPKFIPGRQNGTAVSVYYTLPINIISNDIVAESDKDLRKNAIKTYDDKTIQSADTGVITSYLFSSSSLGYINCDRFWNNTAPKIDYAINFDNTNETDVTIIFHSVKSMMTGFSITNKMTFDNIPQNEKITIVAIRHFDDKTYLAVKETQTSAKGESNLIFQPVTAESLKGELKKLNRFN